MKTGAVVGSPWERLWGPQLRECSISACGAQHLINSGKVSWFENMYLGGPDIPSDMGVVEEVVGVGISGIVEINRKTPGWCYFRSTNSLSYDEWSITFLWSRLTKQERDRIRSGLLKY